MHGLVVGSMTLVFFFKQKTAYEIGTGDWSSDVCSSDLNYWCCCGTQIGIGWGPGLTRELARWMVHGAADIDRKSVV